MYNGGSFSALGGLYAEVIEDMPHSFWDFFDVLYGHAYKGIPLVTAVAMSLYQNEHNGTNYPIACNRKETKDHGEGSDLIGYSVENKKVLVVDDVITAGTAFRESAEFIHTHGGTVVGLVVLFDRQEKGLDTDLSAIQQIKLEYDIPVKSICTFSDLILYIQQTQKLQYMLYDMQEYQKKYGARD